MVVAGAVVVAGVSLLLPGSPGYDPWAWIIWGREVAHLDLAMEKGPSWKPFPVLFTTLFSLAGDAAPTLWLLVARVGGLVALVLAFRVAARLARDLQVLAGAVAAGGLLVVSDFVPLVMRGWAEPILAALVLLAVERHLTGARTAAFALLAAAALIRPETWPFLIGYGAYVWLREPARRYVVVGLLLLVPALWFGPDLVASGDPLRGQERAQRPLPGRPGLAEDPALEVIRQGVDVVPTALLVLAGLSLAAAAVAFARRRRDGPTLIVGMAAVAWIVIVAAMAEAGFSGNPRYLFPAAALACVLAGVGTARVAQAAVAGAGRVLERGTTSHALGLAAVLAAVVVPTAISAIGRLDDGIVRIRAQAELPDDLNNAVARAGGRERLLACGGVFTGPHEFPLVAWTLELHLRELSTQPAAPGVVVRVDPAQPEAGPRFAPRARTEHWEILAACGR